MDEERVKREDYVKCEACTKKAGSPVVYHKSVLDSKDEDLFGSTAGLYCPKGHFLQDAGAGA